MQNKKQKRQNSRIEFKFQLKDNENQIKNNVKKSLSTQLKDFLMTKLYQ